MTTTEPMIDERNEMAKERNREAVDRTLMAWIRGSLSFIGFGFGIDVITRGLESTALGNAPDLAASARVLGLSFIVVALFGVIVAMVQYRQGMKEIEVGGYRSTPSFPLGLLAVAALGLFGLFAVISIVIGALAS